MCCDACFRGHTQKAEQRVTGKERIFFRWERERDELQAKSGGLRKSAAGVRMRERRARREGKVSHVEQEVLNETTFIVFSQLRVDQKEVRSAFSTS